MSDKSSMKEGEVRIIRPGVVGLRVRTKEEALVAQSTMVAMLDLIGTTNDVFIRREPTIESEQDFDTGALRITVSVRFQVAAPLIPGQPRRVMASEKEHYDEAPKAAP